MRNKKFIYGIAVLIILPFLLNSCGKEPSQETKPLYEIQKNYKIPKFNADYAYNQVEAQVNFGPRNPGSTGHAETLAYLQKELSQYADTLILQQFTYPGYNNVVLHLTNIIAKFNPNKKHRLLFCAHWDTRPRAEHATNPANKNKPILGANDGASGCGVLMELAQLLKNHKVNYGVDLVFLDGEDYGKEDDLNDFCLGSKYYAANLNTKDAPAFGVLLDMVGDKQAVFPKEPYSVQYAPDAVNLIWGIAAQLNCSTFSQTTGHAIYDDHIPLNQAGFPTVDIIDSELVGADTPNKRRNYWHSEHDTMVNIGKGTLQQVGDVLTHLIYSIQFNS